MTKGDQQPATIGAVREIVLEAADAILKGVEQMLAEHNTRINEMDERLQRVENEVTWLRRDFKDIKPEFADTPSRREFNELKARVNRAHPTS